MGTRGISPQITGAVTNDATTISIADEVGSTSSADDNRTYSDERSGENECSSSKRIRTENRGS